MKIQTITNNQELAEQFYDQITAMEKQLARMKKQLAKLFHTPKYGSTEWWEQEEKEADEDIKAGRLYILNDVDDLDKPLHKLKKWK